MMVENNSQSQNVESLDSMLQPAVSPVRGAVVVAPAAAIVLGREDEVGQPQVGESEVQWHEVATIALEGWSKHGEEVEEEG